MSVSRGDENAVGRYACLFRGQLLRFVTDGPGDHAAVDDGNGNAHLAPLQDEAAGLEIPGVHLPAPALGESSADYVGVKGTRHVLHIDSGVQLLFGDLGRCDPGEEEGEQEKYVATFTVHGKTPYSLTIFAA